jgi:hypothetical protein
MSQEVLSDQRSPRTRSDERERGSSVLIFSTLLQRWLGEASQADQNKVQFQPHHGPVNVMTLGFATDMSSEQQDPDA